MENKNFGKCTPNATQLNGDPQLGGSDVNHLSTSQRVICYVRGGKNCQLQQNSYLTKIRKVLMQENFKKLRNFN